MNAKPTTPKDVDRLHKLDVNNRPHYVPESAITFDGIPAPGWGPNTMILKTQIGLSLMQGYTTEDELRACGYVPVGELDQAHNRIAELKAELIKLGPKPKKPKEAKK